MEILRFSDFQIKVEEKGIKNPKITFGFSSVKLVSLPFFWDIAGQLFLWIISVLLALNSPTLFFGILFFCVSWYFFYFHFIGLCICKIDFISKTISIKNRIFLFNLLRKIFGIDTEINFSDVKSVSHKEGLLLNRFGGGYETRQLLLLETNKDPAIVISQFKHEHEAEYIKAMLNNFLLNKEKIIA